MRFYLLAVALTFLMPRLLRPLFARLRAGIAIAAWSGALWFATVDASPWWVIAIGVLGTAAAMIPVTAATRFRRADAILIPVFASVFMALIDIAPSLSTARHVAIAVGIVFIVRELAGNPDCFVFAPLALLLQAHFNAAHLRYNGWPPLLVAIVTPVAMRFILRPSWHRPLRRAIAFVIYPIAILGFASASSKLAAEGLPHADLFEDGHRYAPASEMLRGERPYVDIVPVHGFVEDGLLDYVTMRTGPVTIGRVAKRHGVISALNTVATYAIAAGATGSPEVGLLTYFLAICLGLGGGPLRVLPALAALAFAVTAARSKRPRLLAYAGACVVIASLTSLDFGAYAFLALVTAIALMRGARRPALLAAATGIAIAGACVVILLAAFGCLTAYFRVTLFELLPVSTASTIGLPPPLSIPFPDVLTSVFAWPGVVLVALALVIVVLATVRNRPILVIAVFIIASGAYYAERHQLYFIFALTPLIAVSVFYLFRHSRAAAIAAVIVIAIAAHPTNTLDTIELLRRARGPIDHDLAEVTGVPRARGAFFRTSDALIVESVHRYAQDRLGADDTFFDFTDVPNLYFLLNRNCPIRQIAVPFYEPEAMQRDVIARIARNPHVRAALVPADPHSGIDGVPNAVRAPLVWQYLQQNFEPDVTAGTIAIWRRVRF